MSEDKHAHNPDMVEKDAPNNLILLITILLICLFIVASVAGVWRFVTDEHRRESDTKSAEKRNPVLHKIRTSNAKWLKTTGMNLGFYTTAMTMISDQGLLPKAEIERLKTYTDVDQAEELRKIFAGNPTLKSKILSAYTKSGEPLNRVSESVAMNMLLQKPHLLQPLGKKDARSIGKPVKPVENKPVEKKPVENKPVEKKPVVKEPVVKKPVVKEPVVKEPVVKEPVVKEPVVKKPDLKAPEVKKPELKAPEVKKPKVKAPEVKKPELKKPEVRVKNPNEEKPEVKVKKPEVKVKKPEVKVKKPEVKVKNPNEEKIDKKP